MSTATGVSAITTAAISPATGPNDRRTAWKSTITVATPASACGARMLSGLRPNSRTESPMSIVESGGLSTVMKLPASNDPKNQAFQLSDAASAAAE